MSERSPEHNQSSTAALRQYELDCYWKRASYADVLMNVSRYLEDELQIDDSSRLVYDLVSRGSLPDQQLFEVSPRETHERLMLLPVTEVSNYQMALLGPDKYHEWFSSAVSIALNCDKRLHPNHGYCVSKAPHSAVKCGASSICPLRAIRNKVIDDISPTQEALATSLWGTIVTEEVASTELTTISRHGLIYPNVVPQLMAQYRQARLRAS